MFAFPWRCERKCHKNVTFKVNVSYQSEDLTVREKFSEISPSVSNHTLYVCVYVCTAKLKIVILREQQLDSTKTFQNVLITNKYTFSGLGSIYVPVTVFGYCQNSKYTVHALLSCSWV